MKTITYDEFKNSNQSYWSDKKAVVLKEISNLAGDVIEPGTTVQIINKSNSRFKEGNEFKDGYFDVQNGENVFCGVKHDLLSMDLSPVVVFYKFNRKDMPEVISIKEIVTKFIGTDPELQMVEFGLSFERQILTSMIKFGAFGRLSEPIWIELFAEYKKQKAEFACSHDL